VWALNLSDDGPSDPACEDGVCVFNTYSCTTFALEAETGKHLWSWWLGSPQLATTVIADGVVYASYPGPSHSVQAKFVLGAFDLKTGASKWQRWIDGEVNSTPVAYRGHIYLATTMGTLYEFLATDGGVVSVLRNRIATPPLVTERGILFAGDAPPPTNELIRSSGAIFPALESASAVAGRIAPKPRPLIVEHRIVSVDPSGQVIAKNHATGRELWRAELDGASTLAAPLLYAGESILVSTTQGLIRRLEPDSGDVLASFDLASGPLASQPIAVDGWIYAGTTSGALVAYDTGDPELTGWPMLGGTPDRQGTVGN